MKSICVHWYFFNGCSFYCFWTIIFCQKNLEIHWFKRRHYKMANNYVLWLYLKVLRPLHTLKRASYATSPISRMELSICSVSSQQTTEQFMCCTTRWGRKILKWTYIFCAYNLRSKWNWSRCFMKCILISGLVLVCSLWLWYFRIILACFSGL